MSLAFLTLITLAAAGPQCGCGPRDPDRDLLLSAHGYVICGFRESGVGEVIIGSEYEIFRCESGEVVLARDAVDRSSFEVSAEGLIVVDLSAWPAGENWSWIDLPVREWRLLPGAQGGAQARSLLVGPPLAEARVAEVLELYRRLLAGQGQDGGIEVEELVGRLFVGALGGSAELQRLFAGLPEALALDGYAAEIYTEAATLLTLAHATGRR